MSIIKCLHPHIQLIEVKNTRFISWVPDILKETMTLVKAVFAIVGGSAGRLADGPKNLRNFHKNAIVHAWLKDFNYTLLFRP